MESHGKKPPGDKSVLRTLERGLAVLDVLGSAEGGHSLSEIAQRLDLSVGVTHRLLQTLMHAGYVEQQPRTRHYQLGLKILELRGATVGAIRMAAEARPFLRDLMLRVGLLTHLAVYRGGAVVYIDRVDSPDSLARYVPIGMKAPAHATSLGKALLAYAPDEEVRAFLSRCALTEFTPMTISDAETLRHELDVTRERGYALDRGESQIDRYCLAAPIFDYTEQAVAAVSVAGTHERIEPHVAELAPLVVAAAREISARFGYRSAEELALTGRSLIPAWNPEPPDSRRDAAAAPGSRIDRGGLEMTRQMGRRSSRKGDL